MSEFDSVLNKSTDAKQPNGQSTAEKQTSGASKKEKRNQCYAMIDEACLEAVSSPEKMMDFLKVQSHFEKYSLNNNLLIFHQRPGATRIKCFDDWVKANQSVKGGAKSFYILERTTYMVGDEERPGYNAKAMFDVLDLRDPVVKPSVQYEPKKLIAALVHNAPVPITTVQDYPKDKSDGAFYSIKAKKIFARAGMSADEIITSVTQALVHAELAKKDANYRPEDHEFTARSVAYSIASKFGIPTDKATLFSIPPVLSGKEMEDIKPTLAEIHDNIKLISERMREALEQSKSADKAKDEQEAR